MRQHSYQYTWNSDCAVECSYCGKSLNEYVASYDKEPCPNRNDDGSIKTDRRVFNLEYTRLIRDMGFDKAVEVINEQSRNSMYPKERW